MPCSKSAVPLPPAQGVEDPDGPCRPKLHSLFTDLSLFTPGDLDASRGVAASATVLDSGTSITTVPSVAMVTASSVAWSETPSSTLAGRFAV